VACPVMDWVFVGGLSDPIRPFNSVYLFIRCSSSAAFLFAAYLALMCLGRVERKKPETFQKHRDVPTSTVGQGQTSFLSVVEDNELYSSFKLP
ncbi:hypothetical protein A2U01_0075602, partial [Trifolium medium]|nr:hypothetical protein [Trifolium medium]